MTASGRTPPVTTSDTGTLRRAHEGEGDGVIDVEAANVAPEKVDETGALCKGVRDAASEAEAEAVDVTSAVPELDASALGVGNAPARLCEGVSDTLGERACVALVDAVGVTDKLGTTALPVDVTVMI